MQSPLICNTCAYAHTKKIPYDDFPDYTETYCDVLKSNVNILCCNGDDSKESDWLKLGCASHSNALHPGMLDAIIGFLKQLKCTYTEEEMRKGVSLKLSQRFGAARVTTGSIIDLIESCKDPEFVEGLMKQNEKQKED
jgi:hypothetical protein